MNLQQFKALILIVTAVAALFAASPFLYTFIAPPKTESLTELALLGQYHNATYPGGVAENATNRIYLNVANRLGTTAYYQIQIKFSNLTQSSPGTFNKTSSTQRSIGAMSLVVPNGASTELPIDFTFQAHLDQRIEGLLHMDNINVNGEPLNTNATTIRWDISRNGFYGNLIFELWRYNDSTNAFQYDQRYINLWLKFYVT